MAAIAPPDRPVSIPERVWGGLEPAENPCYTAVSAVFQSLRGFGVGWSEPLKLTSSDISSFQSLRGFGVGWSCSLRLRATPPASFNP